MALPSILIVGAGPSGLLLALMLGKQGIPVRLLEAAASLDNRPRATHYSPPAVYELRRAGVLDDMEIEGSFIPNGACWRKLNGEFLAGVAAPGNNDADQTPMLCLPLNKLNRILQRQIDRLPHVQILYSHKVTGLGQDEGKAWVDVETPSGVQQLEAQFIVGCDGANSQIRRSLFGDWEFPGFTWDQQIVATNTYYPFERHGFDWDSNFIIHPEHWYMAARISDDGMWRVTYGEIPGLSFDELKSRQPERFKALLPGNPNPGDYKIASFSPYKVHQRLAKRMRVGRFLLAADAAHCKAALANDSPDPFCSSWLTTWCSGLVCNPFGGLGLTGGIVDVGGLYDCLAGIYTGEADDSILDIYDTIRRSKYDHLINPFSTANLQLLFGQNPETALEDSELLKTCKKAEASPEVVSQQRQGIDALQYDFRQHYRK